MHCQIKASTRSRAWRWAAYAFALLASVPAAAQPPVPDILYYTFDQSGTTLTNHATAPPTGTATASIVGGTLAQSASFSSTLSALSGTGASSSTDYVDTGWATSLPGSWTISFFTSGIPVGTTLVYIFGDVNAGGFRCFTNGVAGSENWILRGGLTDVTVSGAAGSNTHMVTFVYDQPNAVIKGYKDGVLVTTVAEATVTVSGTGPFKVGGYSTNAGLNGKMADFRLYGRVLTDAEIAEIYTFGVNSHFVGGNVSSLGGSGLTLQLNGGDDLPIAADGSYKFATPLADGTDYAVTVSSQPTNLSQTCAVSNDSGVISGANIGNADVACTTNNYVVGGSVSGLTGTGLTLQLNGANDLPIVADGSFAFPSMVDGSAYDVTVSGQPSNQNCVVTNGNGSLAGADVNDIDVTCTTTTRTVGGSVSGLAGTGLKLQLNGANDLPIAADGPFAFPAIADGSSYEVTISSQPTNLSQTCQVSNASGVLAGADVSNVNVTCATNGFTVAGSISGLSGSNLQLQINGADTQITPQHATSFAFSALPDGTVWAVSVAQQPDTPTQTCNVTNAGGTLAGSNVNNVNVNCTTNAYTVSGSVVGWNGNNFTLQLNGGSDLAVNNGVFAFLTPIYSGNTYLVSVSQQPSNQTCSVSNASGTVTNANIGNVVVNCADSKLTLTIDDNHDYARYGQVLDYVVTLTNDGDATASYVSVTSSGTSLDLTNAHWQCIGGNNGAACTASGTGALNDTVTLPAKRSVAWIVSAQVQDTSASVVGMEVNAAGAASVADFDTPVFFRDGFDVANSDGARAPVVAGADISSGDASEVATLTAPSGNRIDTVKTLRSGSDEIRVERIALAESEYIRLLQHAASGAEHASAWVAATPLAHLIVAIIGGTDAQRVVLLEGAEQSLALPIAP